MKILSKFTDEAYALMRIVAGFMFAFHGAQKILGILSDMPSPAVGSQIWIGGVIELVAGLLIMLGFKTRWVAFLASGEMAVAYFQFHWKFQFTSLFFPAINKGELAVLYCFVFLYIATRGGAKWALDKKS
jgi:putative oxidoreductase